MASSSTDGKSPFRENAPFGSASRPRRPRIGMADLAKASVVVLASELQTATALTCYCFGHCPPSAGGAAAQNGTCIAKRGAKCFAAVEEVFDPETNRLVSERTFGCLPPEETGLLQCQGNLVPHLTPTSIACCSDEDLCNKYLRPMYEPTAVDDEYDGANGRTYETYHIALLISFFICLVVFVIVVTLFYLRYKRREDRRQKYLKGIERRPEAFLKQGGTLSDLIDHSSSGSGLPLLVQRTIAKQIEMGRKIGQGRYGEVYKALWRTENVAVKVFKTNDEASWFRETAIYQSVLMRHENILGFIAADIKGTGGWTQMLLITDYHEHGSLKDFLEKDTLSVNEMLHMFYSIANGLTHLHTAGTPIAHRDIKSRNILVKANRTCCLADFGLAVKYEKEEVDLGGPNPRSGTVRYMAPEVLNETLNPQVFDEFLFADMYSFSLVMWELLRRTRSTGGPDDNKQVYWDSPELPYFEYVRQDPSFQEMLGVVCQKDVRPSLEARWLHSELSGVTQLMRECWYTNPKSRLGALRVKKAVGDMARDNNRHDGIDKYSEVKHHWVNES